MNLPDWMAHGLRLPAIAAPMFLVSGPDLVIASRRAGIIGSFPVSNARTIEQLDEWMMRIAAESGPDDPIWALNMIVHRSYTRLPEELDLLAKHRPRIVITALGSPKPVIEAVHAYGGVVFADVNSVAQAEKAAAAGVDGLVLVSAGAGGHTGGLSAFAFVPAVREFFDGIVVLGGAISTGRAVKAAQILGADLAYLGTSLISAEESMAQAEYKDMIVRAGSEDIVLSAALTGAPANWLRESLISAGYDPEALVGQKTTMNLGAPDSAQAKRWRDVWSAGQGVGAVKRAAATADIIGALIAEYQQAQ
ncbi:MAG TPA: nitronate monooxygenase [Verrucomicrobiae bacterium]|jgi:nitronate monooxygenase|nr:nitronate monooxygenase [Verrucomicrobiae bacterium]